MTVASALWRRLDVPGHDACKLERSGDGWQIEGAAVFLHDGAPAQLRYRVACDRGWRTTEGEIRGWAGALRVAFLVARSSAGVWTVNGEVVAGMERCSDLDLGFTPATNLLQIRRMGLAVGQSADCPVAWLDAPGGELEILPQWYERRTETSYWYEAPAACYSGLLEVDANGFVRRYPGLWESES
jgi:hypothetical protein